MAMIGATKAAQLLGCTRQNLDKLRKSGKLSAQRGNRNNWLYSQDDIDAYLAASTDLPKHISDDQPFTREQPVGAQPQPELASNQEQLLAQLIALHEQLKESQNNSLEGVVKAATEPLLAQIDALRQDKERLEAELRAMRSRGFWDRVWGREPSA